MAVELSMSVCNYDRTAALFDGRAPIEGCDVTAVALEPEESFHRAFKFQEFDVTEMSMSSYLVTLSRGDNHYVAIPAFVSRLFRHSSIYVRTDRIKTPADLKGKTLGLPEYQMTANVWVRGTLQEEYGIAPKDIKWRRGGLEEPGREERAKITLPKDIDLQAVPADRTISDMLAKGEKLPVDFTNRVIYYVGPVDPVRDEVVGPAGPTTATRMDKFTRQILEQTGLLGMIGKSERGPVAIEAIKKHKSAYLMAVGGAAYLVGERGPEVFRPATGGVVEPVSGGGVTVNVSVDGGAPALLRSEAQIAQMLARAVSLGARRM